MQKKNNYNFLNQRLIYVQEIEKLRDLYTCWALIIETEKNAKSYGQSSYQKFS